MLHDYCTNLHPSHMSPNHLCHSLDGKFHLLPYEIDLPTTIIENKGLLYMFQEKQVVLYVLVDNNIIMITATVMMQENTTFHVFIATVK